MEEVGVVDDDEGLVVVAAWVQRKHVYYDWSWNHYYYKSDENHPDGNDENLDEKHDGNDDQIHDESDENHPHKNHYEWDGWTKNSKSNLVENLDGTGDENLDDENLEDENHLQGKDGIENLVEIHSHNHSVAIDQHWVEEKAKFLL